MPNEITRITPHEKHNLRLDCDDCSSLHGHRFWYRVPAMDSGGTLMTDYTELLERLSQIVQVSSQPPPIQPMLLRMRETCADAHASIRELEAERDELRGALREVVGDLRAMLDAWASLRAALAKKDKNHD